MISSLKQLVSTLLARYSDISNEKDTVSIESIDSDIRSFLWTFRRFVSVSKLLQIITEQVNRVCDVNENTNINSGSKIGMKESIVHFLWIWVFLFFNVDFRMKRKLVFTVLDNVHRLGSSKENEFKLFIIRMFIGTKKKTSIAFTVFSSSPMKNSPSSASLQQLGHHSHSLSFNGNDSPLISSTSGNHSSYVSTTYSPDDIEMIQDISERHFTDILEIPTQLIANTLTLQEFELFQAIDLTEFLERVGWISKRSNTEKTSTSGGTTTNSSSIIDEKGLENSKLKFEKLTQQFNKVSYWVTTEIVTQKDKSRQVSLLEKFIDIAKRCETLNNFNSVLEIVSGINHFSVLRLKQLWAGISEKSMKTFEALDQLMSSNSNFKRYQEELRNRKSPVIPYLGLFLRDFTYMMENNRRSKSIDFELIKLLGRRLDFIHSLRSTPYHLQTTASALKFLREVSFMSDDEWLYASSLLIEGLPPGATSGSGSEVNAAQRRDERLSMSLASIDSSPSSSPISSLNSSPSSSAINYPSPLSSATSTTKISSTLSDTPSGDDNNST